MMVLITRGMPVTAVVDVPHLAVISMRMLETYPFVEWVFL